MVCLTVEDMHLLVGRMMFFTLRWNLQNSLFPQETRIVKSVATPKGTDTIGRPGQRSAMRLLNAQHGVSCCVLSSAASTAGAEFPLMKLTVVLYSAELGC